MFCFVSLDSRDVYVCVNLFADSHVHLMNVSNFDRIILVLMQPFQTFLQSYST